MAHMFKRQIPDLPGVPVPDWELLRHLEKLFDPYRPVRRPREGDSLFSATDSRGTYTASSVEELHQEIEAQPEPPQSIRLFTFGKTPFGVDFELGVEVTPYQSSTLLYAEDESIVTHFATRVTELVQQAAQRRSSDPAETALEQASLRAAERYALERAEQPEYVNVVVDVVPPRAKKSIRRVVGYVYDHYVKAIITGVAIAVTVAVILHFLGRLGL